MPLLSIKSKRKDYRLVGVTVPPRVHNYLTLHTMVHGIPKSTLLKTLIENWMQEQLQVQSEEELMVELIGVIYNEWKIKKRTHPRLTLNDFIQRLMTELKSKGFNMQQMELIDKGVKRYATKK